MKGLFGKGGKNGNSGLSSKGAEVLSLQGQLREAEAHAQSFREAIRRQEELIRNARAGVPGLPDLAGEREDLLAEIAMGKAQERDLHALDERISAGKKKHDEATASAQKTIGPAEATIAGLRRKLDRAEGEAHRIKAECKEALGRFLNVEVETAALEYVECAETLVRAYGKVYGLAQLARSHGFRKKLGLAVYWDSLRIPILTSASAEGKITSGHKYHLCDGVAYDSRFGCADVLQQERIEGLGISLGSEGVPSGEGVSHSEDLPASAEVPG
jgi:hypothetical protein